MGNQNQLQWIERNLDLVTPPVLEVGARHYNPGSAIDYRAAVGTTDYIGADLSDGDNVDVVVDFTHNAVEVQRALGNRRFGTVICNSVLEHVDQPEIACANILSVVDPGAVLFVSVPFTWRHHGYPSDFWRFTEAGLQRLFPRVVWLRERSTISSTVDGDEQPIDSDINTFVVSDLRALDPRIKRWLPERVRRSVLPPRLRDHNYVLIPSLINLVGRVVGPSRP